MSRDERKDSPHYNYISSRTTGTPAFQPVDIGDVPPPAVDQSNVQSVLSTLHRQIRSQQDTIDVLTRQNATKDSKIKELTLKIAELKNAVPQNLPTQQPNETESFSLPSIPHSSSSFWTKFGSPKHSSANRKYRLKSDGSNDGYSSGEDIEVIRQTGDDYKEPDLEPIKQGWMCKKSENLHKYNPRWVVLFTNFIMYFKQCPLFNDSNVETHRKRSGSAFQTESSRRKSIGEIINQTTNNVTALNHPTGILYLSHYNVSVRRDTKKWDITFVPNQKAIDLGMISRYVKIRFRCKGLTEVNQWVDAIRIAVSSKHHGYIKYEISTRKEMSQTFEATKEDFSDIEEEKMSGGGIEKLRLGASLTLQESVGKDSLSFENAVTETNEECCDAKEEKEVRLIGMKDVANMFREIETLKAEIEKLELKNEKCINEKKEIETKLNELSEKMVSTKSNLEQCLHAKTEEINNLKHKHDLSFNNLQLTIGKMRDETIKKEKMIEKLRKLVDNFVSNDKTVLKYVDLMRKWNLSLFGLSLQGCGVHLLSQEKERESCNDDEEEEEEEDEKGEDGETKDESRTYTNGDNDNVHTESKRKTSFWKFPWKTKKQRSASVNIVSSQIGKEEQPVQLLSNKKKKSKVGNGRRNRLAVVGCRDIYMECQRGCMQLLDETYQLTQTSAERPRIVKEMLKTYADLVRQHLKTTLRYAALQESHDATREEMRVYKAELENAMEMKDRRERETEANFMAQAHLSPF